MTERGHSLQVVSVTPDNKYKLEEGELEKLLLREDVRDLPVVVVSVAGAYRTGKSFLLNFLLRYLSAPLSAQQDGSWVGEDSEPLVGFQWRGGIQRSTKGILMWSEPFITTLPSGTKAAILLLDTQGSFDKWSTVRNMHMDNSTIFTLSSLVSSIQIFNTVQNIQEEDFQHLGLLTEYGNLVNSGESKPKPFQTLEFLVRDWQFPEDHPFGTVGGEHLVQENLKINPDMKLLREHIRSSFEKVSGFLMPHPGFRVLRRAYKGAIKDVDPDFRMQLINFANSIFGQEKLIPKKNNGDIIKARNLITYFKCYIELFNNDTIPTPENILAMTAKAGLLNDARDVYEKGMNAECGPNQPGVSSADLKYLHQKHIQAATDFYNNKMGPQKDADVFFAKVTKELDDQLPLFLISNLPKVQAAIEKAKIGYDEAIQNISNNQPLCVHVRDVEKIHKMGVDAATKIFDASRRRITDGYDEERAKFLRGFEKQYALLRLTNEQNNQMAVFELKMEFWQKMMSTVSQKRSLADVEFRKEHTDALNNALGSFKTKRNMPDNYNEDVHKNNLSKGIHDTFIQLKMINKSWNKEVIRETIEKYDSYMRDHWDEANQYLHPDDLEDIHQEAICAALPVFQSQKKCSVEFDSEDENESAMKEIFEQRYRGFKESLCDCVCHRTRS